MELGQYKWDPESDLIAEGAFAEVFKAVDTNANNRVVALKIYRESVAKGTTSGDSIQKKYTLEREFEQIDSLSHSNVISYYGLNYIHHNDMMGRSSSYPVIIMEYAAEGTFVDFMRTKPSSDVVFKLLKDVIEGLCYLHSEGVIHRDLKPANILVSRNRKGEPVAKITDFGISRDLLTEKTIEQSMTEGIGTPHYMAPEQFFKRKFGLNEEISERTDIWGIGIVMFWMLTGELPFGNNSKDYELIREAIVNEEPDLSKVPSAFVDIVLTCLQKNAMDRYSSAKTLFSQLPNQEVVEQKLDNNSPAERKESYSLSDTQFEKKESVTKWPILEENQKKTPTKKVIIIASLILAALVAGYSGYMLYINSKVNGLLEDAWSYYSSGEHEKAYSTYLEASEYNSGEAFYHLASMTQLGIGASKDFKLSEVYIQKSIDQGYTMASFLRGWAFKDGLGIEVDSLKAVGYFDEALPQIMRLAERNDPEAQNLMGLLYYYGYAVEKDLEKSFDYNQKSALQGHPSALTNLGVTYYSGEGVEQDYAKAKEWFEKGAAVNSYRSYYYLGNIYYNGYGVEQNYETAFNNYKTAADNNFVSAQSQVGYMYNLGHHVTKSKSDAVWWYRKAAESGGVVAQYNVGTVYEGDKNFKEAVKWYVKSANNKYSNAMYSAALVYQNHLDNYDSAYYWYHKAAEKEYISAQFKLAYNFAEGIGYEINYDSAVFWYKKASDLGSSTAQNNLGLLYKQGKGVEVNAKSAFDWFKKSAEGGSYYGQYNLGDAYFNAVGVAENYEEAARWYKKSAAQGFSNAQYMMGVLHEFGTGVDKDYNAAFQWYEKAYLQGLMAAQYRVARFYYFGTGVSQNLNKAGNLIVKPAEQGISGSEYLLGAMYFYGSGKVKNMTTAKYWLTKAANKGEALAMARLGDVYSSNDLNNDYKSAIFWYRKAADKNDSWSQYKLGVFQYYGSGGLSKSKSQAKVWLDKSCNNGEEQACNTIKQWF